MSDDNAATLRGAQAKHLIEHSLLNEAFDELERAYIEKWRTTEALDTQAREKLFIAVNVIGKVKQHLHTTLADGKVAEKELELMTAEVRRKRFGIV